MELLIRKSDKAIIVAKPNGSKWSKTEKESSTFKVVRMDDAEFAKTHAAATAKLSAKEEMISLKDITDTLASKRPNAHIGFPLCTWETENPVTNVEKIVVKKESSFVLTTITSAVKEGGFDKVDATKTKSDTEKVVVEVIR